MKLKLESTLDHNIVYHSSHHQSTLEYDMFELQIPDMKVVEEKLEDERKRRLLALPRREAGVFQRLTRDLSWKDRVMLILLLVIVIQQFLVFKFVLG